MKVKWKMAYWWVKGTRVGRRKTCQKATAKSQKEITMVAWTRVAVVEVIRNELIQGIMETEPKEPAAE